MGHILTIDWESNEEKNLEWLAAIQQLSTVRISQPANDVDVPPKSTHGVIFQAIHRGSNPETARKLLEDFAAEVEQTILNDAKSVTWNVQTGLHDSVVKFGK